MNRFSPSGGVISPTHVADTIMAPKWTGEIPNLMAAGTKIGVNIVTIGIESIKHPATSKITVTSSKKPRGLW
jgi:hypothetical protein